MFYCILIESSIKGSQVPGSQNWSRNRRGTLLTGAQLGFLYNQDYLPRLRQFSHTKQSKSAHKDQSGKVVPQLKFPLPRWLYCVKLTNTNQQNCPFVNLTHKHLTSKSQCFFSCLSPRSHVNVIILKSLLWKSHSLYNFPPDTQIHHQTITLLFLFILKILCRHHSTKYNLL